MTPNRVVTREIWLKERIALLEQEKSLTRRADELAKARQRLPWVEVKENYVFEGPDGQLGLADLFSSHS